METLGHMINMQLLDCMDKAITLQRVILLAFNGKERLFRM